MAIQAKFVEKVQFGLHYAETECEHSLKLKTSIYIPNMIDYYKCIVSVVFCEINEWGLTCIFVKV